MHASRVLRLLAIAILVVVAAIAIGAASRPHSVELSLSSPQLGEVAVLAVLVLAGAMGLLLGSSLNSIWGLAGAEAPRQGRRSRLPWGVQVVISLVPFMVIVFLIAAAIHRSTAGLQPQGMLPVQPVAATDSATGGADLMLACAGVALAGFLVAAVLFERTRPVRLVRTVPQDSVAAILDEGLGALLAEHDPRKAVIAAYVAMERSMARRGWARRPHEAPTEYLARVLGVAPSRAQDLDELVNLYEFARFSEHTVTPAMRDAAVDSVRRLRADLREPV